MIELPKFNNPEELLKWMKSNIQYEPYSDRWRLKTTEQLLKSGKGNCIDQSYFAKEQLEHMGYECQLWMIIEYENDIYKDSQQSHVFVTYSNAGFYEWFENSWAEYRGIHHCDEESELEFMARDWFKKQARLPHVWFGQISQAKYGCKYKPDFLKQSLKNVTLSEGVNQIDDYTVPIYEQLQYLLTIDEAYFGKTESIIAIENQIDRLRKRYIGTKLIPTSADTDIVSINTMVEKQFGFGNFCLYIIHDPIAAAMTVPLEFNFSLERKDNNYIVDASSYRFKKEYNYTCMVIMTTGLIFNPEFTTEEIMACLLYELGMNFYSCFSHTNAILSNVYAITNIISRIASAVQMWMWMQSFGKQKLDNQLQAQAVKNKDQTISNLSPEVLAVLDTKSPEEQDKIANGILSLEREKLKASQPEVPKKMSTAINIIFGVEQIGEFLMSPLWTSLNKKLTSQFKQNSTVQSATIGLMNYINLIAKYAINNFWTLFQYGQQMMSGTLFKWATVMDLIVPWRSALGMAKNPMSWLAQPINYKVERAANNFPTMYGYAAPMVSYFEKMKTARKIEWVSHFVKANPIVGVLCDVALLPSKILFSVFDSNPHNLSRCHDQIRLLASELNNKELPPKMKSALLRDIRACEVEIMELTKISNGISDPDIAKKLFNRAFESYLGGVGLRDRLFDSKRKFAEYDANIKAKMSEAGVLPEYIDESFVAMEDSEEFGYRNGRVYSLEDEVDSTEGRGSIKRGTKEIHEEDKLLESVIAMVDFLDPCDDIRINYAHEGGI